MVVIKQCQNDDDDIPSNSSLPWYRSHTLWSNMIRRTFDERYRSHGNFLDAHPAITTKMRSVLCDWLIEVDIQLDD